jgi:hypothetical protein
MKLAGLISMHMMLRPSPTACARHRGDIDQGSAVFYTASNSAEVVTKRQELAGHSKRAAWTDAREGVLHLRSRREQSSPL